MEIIELEKTYLVKYLPEGLEKFPHKEILDMYIPFDDPHPMLRLRKSGDNYEITRKEHISEDMTEQKEHTIQLTKTQFEALAKAGGKRVRKIRYYYPYKTYTVEIDVFQEGLEGLVLAEIEFQSVQEKKQFTLPEFCLVCVDNEDFIVGGMLAGKKYRDIEKDLHRLGYQNLSKEIATLLGR